MAPENPETINLDPALRAPSTPPSHHLQAPNRGDPINTTPSTVQQQQQCSDGDAPHNIVSADTGSSLAMPFLGVPMFPFPPGTRPKRVQCKNACTNCQKACKRCDDNRPCQRCIRYEITDTCVDSQRKERKKGLKRGPYKKRDRAPDSNVVETGPTYTGPGPGPGPYPGMPYFGPVHYPLNMWNTYTQTGPGTKNESGGHYYPMFTFAPATGPAWPHTHNSTEGGEVVPAPYFPIGFYPTNFIPYPGLYPPHFTIPPSASGGPPPHGFHYTYPPSGSGGPPPPQGFHYTYLPPPPPFPGVFPPRIPNMVGNSSGGSPPGGNAQGPAPTQDTDNDSGTPDQVEEGNVVQDVESDSDAGNDDDDEIGSVLE